MFSKFSIRYYNFFFTQLLYNILVIMCMFFPRPNRADNSSPMLSKSSLTRPPAARANYAKCDTGSLIIFSTSAQTNAITTWPDLMFTTRRRNHSHGTERITFVIGIIIVTCQKYSVQFNLPYCWFSLCSRSKTRWMRLQIREPHPQAFQQDFEILINNN